MTDRTPASAARRALPVLVLAAALSGCAGDTPGGGPMPSNPAADGSTPTGSDAGASPTPSGAPGVAPPSPTPGATVTVTGTVEEGVEVGCLVLTAGGATYLLLGRHAELRAGERVTVEGTLDPDVVTTCMQGTPLRVRSVGAG